MDNVTHAIAGCLLAAPIAGLLERRAGEGSAQIGRVAVVIGVICAELPDADLFYAGPSMEMGKLAYLLHHRGHTHTVAFAVVAACLVWGIALALRRDLRPPPMRRAILGLALAGTLSHVLLDFTNSYGVHPFWPLDNRWYYGDAVFIIEPWLWIAALPPLLLTARGPAGKALFGLLLVVILGAAWRVDSVDRGVAVALTSGAVVWLALVRAAPLSRRVLLGFAAFIGVEAMFFATASVARSVVAHEVGPTLRDVVISPAPGNPFCLDALVAADDRGAYHVTGATIAPFPRVRDAEDCSRASRWASAGATTAHTDRREIRWGSTWSAPVAELRDFAATNCEVAAALRFMRIPVWRRMSNGDVELSDLRYGEGRGSFASILTPPRPARCPRHVPPWLPPRSDLLHSTG
ncbi:MAG: metal-dependent hydrolase [Gemmatimonadaceae bacterium]